MCGTISPTNPTGPAAAVAAPANRVTATTPTVRVRSASAPNDRASSSPSAIALSGRATSAARHSPSTTNGPVAAAMSSPRPANEPAPQNRILAKASGSSSSIPEVTPPSTAPRAIPESVKRIGVAPARPTEPSAYTATVARTAPTNANHT
ncbi:unannotated protein [freshwater metagenome]|uniref:Unannotated protein n=1 Tax=freshwater metagenome TaxID=449393 RepID=A0A6J7F1H2_9ZZZZ